MAHRSQCSSAGDNPLDPNYLPPHYREEYRMAIDALVDGDLDGYYGFLQEANVVNFLSQTEIDFIKCMVRAPHRTSQSERRYMAEDGDGSSDTYWPVHSDLDAPSLDLGWPQQLRFVGPTEVTTLVNPPDPNMPSIKEQVRRMIKNAQQVVAVVMDMFTDVDIFADILNATMRGVAVYILLDELNAHHFVSMVNNCRVNLDEIKLMRVRTVPGTTYFCHTGKSFKGQMMDRFILVDCRAVLTGNYSFMWSFEKIHRCLAHLFLGQLVTTFDEEFRILFAHSELLNVEKALANMSHYSNIHEGHLHMEKTHMFNREFPNMLPERAGHYPEDHMNVSDKMLPFRNIEPTTQPFRESHPFMEQGRQMRGPMEMVGFKRHGYPDVPDYGYMPPQNQPAMRSKQVMEGVVPKGGHFAREPGFYQGGGLQPEYDQYGRFRGQAHHIDQYTGAGYPPEVNEPEPPGAYDHVQRYLQSQPPVEEGQGARNLLSPAQSNPRRHSMGQSYACQTSPTQQNLPDQKRFFNANRKPQDVSQKQGLRDWRISSYLSAYDDGGDMDFPELEGSDLSDNVPCFVPEAPGGPMGAEIRPGTIEFNKMMPPSRNNPPFIQIRNSSPPPLGSDHPPDFTEMIKMPFVIKTPPTSESSCTTEGDKVEETQMRKPKEINLFGEEFLRSKPTRAVQRSSRLRHSLIFSSNLELNTSQDPKDALGENDEDEASKLTARVSQIMDKRRSSAREPFQWSNFVRSATVDDRTIESARSETSLNKIGVDSDVCKVDSQGPAQEKTLPETQSTVLEDKRDESNVWQRSSLMDMNDPDCRLRYFKELAAKRKAELAAAQTSQSNADKAPKKSEAPEKSSTRDGGNKAALTTPVIQDAKCRNEESSEDILHRATDAEKIRIKKKLAEESLQKDTAQTLNPALEKSAESQKSTQKQISTLSGKSSQPVTSSPSKPCSRNVEALSVPAPAETSLSQNQVDSNVLSTALSKTTHIPKETGFSNVVLKESGTPLNIAPNESSQTPAQKPPHILTPISNIVAADSSLIQNRDIVNTLPESKLINTDPSLAKLITPKAESSQQSFTKGEETHKHSALEADASQRTTASENEPVQQPTPLKTDSSQHPTKTEEDSSQKPTAAKSASSQNLPATKTDFSQKHTVMKEESSQQLSAAETEIAQKQTVMEGEPTAVESKSFQHPAENEHAQKPVVQESVQQPTPIKKDSSQQPNAAKSASSPNLPATETDSSQKPTVVKEESSQHLSATESATTQTPTAVESKSFQHPAAKDANSFQQPTATENKHAQKSPAAVADSFQHPTSAETDSSQQPNALEVKSIKLPTATENEHAQKTSATKTDALKQNEHAQKPIAMETEALQHTLAKENKQTSNMSVIELESVQHPTASENEQVLKTVVINVDSCQEPTTFGMSSSKISTVTENEHSLNPTATEAESLLQPIIEGTDFSQHPTAAESESLQQNTATENELSQKPTTVDAESFQKPPALDDTSSRVPTATETDHAQKLTATVGESLQYPLATENEQAQKSVALETEALQHFPATENKDVQKPTAMKVDSSQQSTTVGVSSSVISTATETKHPQKPTETEKPLGTENEPEQKSDATEGESFQHSDTTDSSQQLTTSEVQSSQILTATENEHIQIPHATEGESLINLPAEESNSSQHPTEIKSELVQKSTSDQADCFQQSTETEPDSSRKSSTEADVSQQVTAQETQSSEPPNEADSLQKPSASKGDCSQLPSATKTEPSQHSTETDSFKEPTESLDISHNPTETITDLSSKSTGTDKSPPNLTPLVLDASKHPNSTECESVQHPADTKCVSASPHTLKVTLSPQTISFSDTIPADSHLLFQTGSVSTSTIETNTDENILITTVCTIQSEVKAESESKVVLPTSEIQETSLATSEQKDDNVCQDVSKQGSISTTNVTPEDNSSSQGTIITAEPTSEKPCPQTDDGKIELNSSLEKAQANASISAVNNVNASLNSNELHDSPESSTQTDTSSAQESNSLNDPKREEELHKHEESVSTTTESNQTTPEVENSVTNITDVSKKSESIVTPNSAENAKSQSAVTENPKPIPSAHQSSTANVISCSNLRDDTKVLLEQISAKNQRTKQTPAAANEEKEGGVKSAGQQPSSFPGRPWSSKASTEEKEMLLQKMEQMRKERKVYSRFEAS